MIGLVIFTLSSAWCGLTGTLGLGIGWLIAAPGVQGLGGSVLSRRTMTVIARIFPPHRRGGAMALWGSTAGVAGLVGPILGGVLIDAAGWEWIFLINVPIGILTVILVARLVPKLQTHTHTLDWACVALSSAGPL